MKHLIMRQHIQNKEIKHMSGVKKMSDFFNNKYKVAEKFVSINGEGKRAGQLSVFVRFAGCNLK